MQISQNLHHLLSSRSGYSKNSFVPFCNVGSVSRSYFAGYSRPLAHSSLAREQGATELSKSQADLEPPRDLVEIGVFGPPHGVRGEIRLQAITDALEERLEQSETMWAQRQKGRGPKPLLPILIDDFRSTITKGRQTWLVKIQGVDSLEDAEQLRGHMLSMSAEDRPDIDDADEFYVQELIGMQVFLQSDEKNIGTVTDVFSGTGSHDLLRVQIDEKSQKDDMRLGPSAMIPFVKEIVPVVDREGRRLGIDPPEGLLNIAAMLKNNSTPKKKKGQKQKPASRKEGESDAVQQI